MKRILLLTQELIKLFLFFIIAYIWLSFSVNSKSFAAVLSLSIAFILEMLTLLTSKKLTNKKNLKLFQQKQAEEMFISLLYDQNPTNFFKSMFQTRHKNVKSSRNQIIIYQEDKTILFVPFLRMHKLTIDNLLEIARTNQKIDTLIIYCNNFEENILSMSSLFPFEVVLLNKYDGYTALFKEYEYFPTVIKENKNKQQKFKLFLSSCFSRQKTKGYIISALFLFLFSFYSPWSLYYKIFSSILFCLAIVCMTTRNSLKIKKELV